MKYFAMLNVFLLIQISEEWSKGAFVIKPGDEDIHTANERRLKVNSRLYFPQMNNVQTSPTFICVKAFPMLAVSVESAPLELPVNTWGLTSVMGAQLALDVYRHITLSRFLSFKLQCE